MAAVTMSPLPWRKMRTPAMPSCALVFVSDLEERIYKTATEAQFKKFVSYMYKEASELRILGGMRGARCTCTTVGRIPVAAAARTASACRPPRAVGSSARDACDAYGGK